MLELKRPSGRLRSLFDDKSLMRRFLLICDICFLIFFSKFKIRNLQNFQTTHPNELILIQFSEQIFTQPDVGHGVQREKQACR